MEHYKYFLKFQYINTALKFLKTKGFWVVLSIVIQIKTSQKTNGMEKISLFGSEGSD